MQTERFENQALLRDLDHVLMKYRSLPQNQPARARYNPGLQRELALGGFLGICAGDGFGPEDAALVIEAAAHSPWSVEVAGSALIVPALGLETRPPLALCEGVGRPTRYLAQAQHAIVRDGAMLLLAELEAGDVRQVESGLAYPLGVLSRRPRKSWALDEDLSATVEQLWRVGLAAEAVGLMRSVVNLTLAEVRGRDALPPGTMADRLYADEARVSEALALTIQAAYSLQPPHISAAVDHVEQQIPSLIRDCHNASQAMGLTLEYPLHLWTYRLKFVQAELAGHKQPGQLSGAVC